MTTIHLVHGFNVKDHGEKTVGALAPYLKKDNQEVVVFSYGWLGLMGVFFLNPRIVRKFISTIKPGDIAIGHSNGCVIIHMAAYYGAPLKKVIYINPALSSNVPLAPQVQSADVMHNDGDMAVKFAAWLRALMPWAPIGDPIWWDMGTRGYQPGSYKDSEYSPSGLLNKIIHWLNLTCSKVPLLLFFLRVIFVPVGLFYWLVIGPMEFCMTYYFNNIRPSGHEVSLDMNNLEDKKFFLISTIIPLIIWTVTTLGFF